MSGRVGGELDQLTGLHRTTRHRAGDVEDGARDVGRALAHFRARSSDYVPSLPLHGAHGQALAARMFDLGDRVGASRDAIRAADRWVGTSAAIWAFEAELDRQSLVEGFRGLRTLLGRGQEMGAARTYTGTLGHARTVLSQSRIGAVGRIGARAASVGGVAVGVVDVASGYAENDNGKMARGALGVVSGAAMMSGVPPVQIAGAVVQGGLLVYEYREEIADFSRAVKENVVDDVRQKVETAGKVARGAGDMVGAAANFVGGLF